MDSYRWNGRTAFACIVAVSLASSWGCARVGPRTDTPADAPSGSVEAGTAPSPPAPEPAPSSSADSTPGTRAGSPGQAGPAQACPRTRGQVVVELVNQERKKAGLPPLRVDERLVAAAGAHAQDMARSGITGHVGSDGSEPPQRVHRAGYRFGRVGENVAAGVPTAADVMAGWMASEHHRDNILEGAYDDIGVAFVDVAGSEYGTYWVQVFGSLLDPDGGEHLLACNP